MDRHSILLELVSFYSDLGPHLPRMLEWAVLSNVCRK